MKENRSLYCYYHKNKYCLHTVITRVLIRMCNHSSCVQWDLMISTGSRLSTSDEEMMNEIHFWADGVFGSIIAIIGLVMNSLAIYILSTKEELSHITTEILCKLLVSENMYLLLKLIKIFYFDFHFKSLAIVIPYFVYPVENICLTMSVFLMICLAHQGYVMTMDLEKYERASACKTSRKRRIVRYMIPVIVSSVIINIPRFFCYKLISLEGNIYEIEKTELRRNFHYVVFYDNFICNILTVFTPINLILFFNWNIYLFVKEKRHEMEEWDMDSNVRNKNKTHANILFLILILFAICHFPRCFLKFYEVFYEPFWIKIFATIERLLLMIHFSLNSFIYMIKNETFRNHFRSILKNSVSLFASKSRKMSTNTFM